MDCDQLTNLVLLVTKQVQYNCEDDAEDDAGDDRKYKGKIF